MSGRIDDVDVRAFPAHGTVFCQDGNAALALNRIVVHHGVHDFLVVGEGTGLTQQLVNHGGFAMVNVGDDGDVTNRRCHENPKTLKTKNKQLAGGRRRTSLQQAL